MVRLGDVFERQITGEWGSECLENETGTNILRTTNFTSGGIINYNNVVVRSIEKTKVESKRLHYGDIILEKSGGTDKTPVGRVVFCDPYIETGTYLCNNFTQAMRVNPSMAVPKYVFYFMWNLHWSGKTELMQNKTTGIRNLQVKSYLNQSFPLPSLNEQRRIAAMLDKVTDLIAKRRQQLDKLDEMVKARFVEMFGDLTVNSFGWEFMPLSKLCDVRDGTHDSPEYLESGYPLLTSKNFTSGEVDFTDCNFISKEDFDKINQRSKVDIGDIVMPMIGTIGSPVIVNTERQFAIKNVALIKFDKSQISNIFVKQILNSDYFKQKTFSSNRGGTQKFIALGDIRKLPTPIVPVELQIRFANFVEQTEKVNSTISRSLEKLETLKKALMQEYFG